MFLALRQLLKLLASIRNNAPALVSLVALASIGLAGFALYVVLTVAGQ